jgi:exonuclease, DNA polymerase III, epsilon subunit family
MKNRKYAVIDVETTGGAGKGHKIIELAVVLSDGRKVLDQWSTLIDPERKIPYAITQLTHINQEMVSGRPKFYQVARRFLEFTENAIFVAHNVYFDYRFIQQEFRELGARFQPTNLHGAFSEEVLPWTLKLFPRPSV